MEIGHERAGGRRRAREAARRLEAVTDTALGQLPLDALLGELLTRVGRILTADTAAILLVDGDTLITRAAKGLEEEVQRGVRIPIGKGFEGRVAAEKRPILIEDVDHAEVLNPILLEKGIRSLLGVPILFEGRVIGVLHVGTLRARRFRRSDAQLLQVVADRVGLGIEYARLLCEAQESSRLKDEFLALLSHELRTPLTPILVWTSMMRQGWLDAARVKQALAVIERSARSQARLIEDLLDVSRVITGKLHLNVRATELGSVVGEAIEVMRPAAEAKGVRLDVAVDSQAGSISGDRERLLQVVWNLLSNAIKFTPRGGRVLVGLERMDSAVELTVSDTGKGIRSEFLPQVFERFRQADSSATRAHGGLGLGLAVVRHLVELHGGTVRAESAGEGRGAAFTVRLPVLGVTQDVNALERRDLTAAEVSAGEELGRLDGLRALVVDDERDTCDAVAAVLQQAGAEVRECVSAGEGLAQLEQWQPDVVVSDIGMPGEDGYAFIRKLRQREAPGGKRTPAVALTAYARVEDAAKALAAGFQMHLAKPIEPGKLISTVADAVGGGSSPTH